MSITGGCYCGELSYESTGDVAMVLQCHCRECQYITGGSPNLIKVVPQDGFRFTKGEPKSFARSDLENPVTRLFCGKCGTAIGTKSPARPGFFVLKIGTMDDSSDFEPKTAIFTIDKQAYHHIPEGIPTFERRP